MRDAAEGAGGGLPGPAPANAPQVIEAKPDEIAYDIPFELPNPGLLPPPMNNATAEDKLPHTLLWIKMCHLVRTLHHHNTLCVRTGVW